MKAIVLITALSGLVALPAAPSPDVSKSDATKPGRAVHDIVRLAIAHGVSQYNDGNHAACAAIYEVAARSIAGLARSESDAGTRKVLEEALARAGEMSDPGRRAWELRRAFDRVLGLGKERSVPARTETSPAESRFRVTREAPL
ncbi:MAG: hypothetical protein JRG86_08340, partial [Deltaproteobacteria bacterium]|nr:hypothetical protein [Deltaproteobacteria bacterium]